MWSEYGKNIDFGAKNARLRRNEVWVLTKYVAPTYNPNAGHLTGTAQFLRINLKPNYTSLDQRADNR